MNKKPVFKQKPCAFCGDEYSPTGRNSKFCSGKCKYQDQRKRYHEKRAAEGNPVGKSGGNYGRTGKDHWAWKHGLRFFTQIRNKIREERRYCERCQKDLKDVTQFHWCVHHKDHDRTNNNIENFELLCKRCHQLEHNCWENLPSK